ncbi:hypothetical protein AVEN_200314-1 [Araneus ventricosus]|uniref:Uncharacterized protein n=1 Tax=Araneus ventricosus TaxID=182803 RepID=A0A4Y2M3K0_ARAVE|nr:hypothetical protein AVEN_200314-1 [Araneus ventricosus]
MPVFSKKNTHCLNVTNGTSVNQVRNVQGDTLQNESIRFGVLSDDMYKLNKRNLDADMQILSRPEGLEVLDEGVYLDGLHKGLFSMDLMHVTSHPPTRDLPEAAIGQS